MRKGILNIFYLDRNMRTCAQYHNNSHTVKMVLEYAQILSTVCRLNGIDQGYKITHANHPSVLWASKSIKNWQLLRSLAYWLNEEFKFRFNKTEDHKSWIVIKELDYPPISGPEILTPIALAMPDDCKGSNSVSSYRRYYKNYKGHLANWSPRNSPSWWK